MTTFVAFLRAVNVGGRGAIRMADLKALGEGLGFTNVRTLLQSGNMVFDGKGTTTAIAAKLADAIEAAHGFRTPVMVRTAAELDAAIGENPFAREAKDDPSHLLVLFTNGKPGGDAKARLAAIRTDKEVLTLGSRELYAYYGGGIGRSKVTVAVLEKALDVSVTGRNWNTVTKLAAMARD
jgi:uncharacterized protein (DUF1697 family)